MKRTILIFAILVLPLVVSAETESIGVIDAQNEGAGTLLIEDENAVDDGITSEKTAEAEREEVLVYLAKWTLIDLVSGEINDEINKAGDSAKSYDGQLKSLAEGVSRLVISLSVIDAVFKVPGIPIVEEYHKGQINITKGAIRVVHFAARNDEERSVRIQSELKKSIIVTKTFKDEIEAEYNISQKDLSAFVSSEKFDMDLMDSQVEAIRNEINSEYIQSQYDIIVSEIE